MQHFTRGTFMVALVCVGFGATSSFADDFSKPTTINLLEKWTTNGSGAYGLPFTYSEDQAGGPGPIRLGNYSTESFGWRVGLPGAGSTKTVSVTYTFPSAVNLGRLTASWRLPNHSPIAIRFKDAAGTTIASDANAAGFGGGVYSYTVNVATNKLTLECDLDNNGLPHSPAAFQCLGIGAYLAAGQRLEIDGSYDILYEEAQVGGPLKMTVSGTGGNAGWYDHVGPGVNNGEKPNGATDSVTYAFSKEYELYGANIPQYDAGRILNRARIETSVDGSIWSTVFYDANGWQYTGEAAPSQYGYMPWQVAKDQSWKARYVRLSWANNTNPVEITEFQLFGIALPEPSALTLAALGGLALLRRRVRR